MTTTKPYRVWHIPQVPGKPFYREVKTLEEANLLLTVLADYDEFQYQNRIKPDYSNASGIEAQDEDGDWCEVDEDRVVIEGCF